MQTGKIGQPYQVGEDKLEERIIYRLDNDGHNLLISKAGITPEEVETIQNGTAEFRIYIDGPIIFFLFKFGRDSWNDAPYSWHTVPRNARGYPEQAADAATLKINVVDAADGIVRGVRQVAFTSEFAGKLNAAITAQANGSFNGLSYAKHLNMVYNQYTAEDMAELADVRMVSW
ncbi:hypothetical protein SCACP_38170 [Sporomusa carbonis]|uniref:hypothetical protein n=1 Tax=Sporomusa carbonis TaxID=3076075 RepID=UPI003A724683